MGSFRIAFALFALAIGNILAAGAAGAQSADDVEALQRQIAHLISPVSTARRWQSAPGPALSEQRLAPTTPAWAPCSTTAQPCTGVQRQYAEARAVLPARPGDPGKKRWEQTMPRSARRCELAHLYSLQRRYAEAEPLFERSLAIMEKTLGPDHPDTAVTLERWAVLHDVRGRYAQAEPLYQRVLAIREKTSGAEHVDVAVVLDKLASTYRVQGRARKPSRAAQTLYRHQGKSAGAGPPQLATVLNELARLHERQRQYAEAEPLTGEFLPSRKRRAA